MSSSLVLTLVITGVVVNAELILGSLTGSDNSGVDTSLIV